MSYRIEISSIAQAEADSIFLQLSQITSPEKAREWYQGFLKTIFIEDAEALSFS